MNVDRISNIVSMIANAGVLIGLVAVIYELDQNTSAVVGETQQGLLELVHASDAWLQDRDFADIVHRAENLGETLQGADARQFAEWLYGKFNVCEHVYERYQEGLLTEYYWRGWDQGCKALLNSEQGRTVWLERRSWYGPGFQEYFDEHLSTF